MILVTKSAFAAFVLSIALVETDAFSTVSRVSGMASPRTWNSPPLFMDVTKDAMNATAYASYAEEEDDDDEPSSNFQNRDNFKVEDTPPVVVQNQDNESEESQPVVVPRPPMQPPRVDEQLQMDLLHAERQIHLYALELKLVREQLTFKQDELMEVENRLRVEKKSLMNKVKEITQMLMQRDQEVNEQSQQLSDTEAKQVTLKREIQSLADRLANSEKAYRNEQKTSRDLRAKLKEAQQALEVQQLEFETAKQELLETIEDEKKAKASVLDKLVQSKIEFDDSLKELENRVKAEESKLAETKNALTETQNKLEQTELKLVESASEKKALQKQSQKELELARAKFDEERSKLEFLIQKEQTQVEKLKKTLEDKSRVVNTDFGNQLLDVLEQELEPTAKTTSPALAAASDPAPAPASSSAPFYTSASPENQLDHTEPTTAARTVYPKWEPPLGNWGTL